MYSLFAFSADIPFNCIQALNLKALLTSKPLLKENLLPNLPACKKRKILALYQSNCFFQLRDFVESSSILYI